MSERDMTEAERRAGVYVEPHLDFHERGCVKRYGAVADELCLCEKRRLGLQEGVGYGNTAPVTIITLDWKGVLKAADERERGLRGLLARCLDAVESEMTDAADTLRANKGYPARDACYRQRLADATKLYEDVKAACSSHNT